MTVMEVPPPHPPTAVKPVAELELEPIFSPMKLQDPMDALCSEVTLAPDHFLDGRKGWSEGEMDLLGVGSDHLPSPVPLT